MLSRFDRIPERDRQTDRWTDGQTDRIAISVSRVNSKAVIRRRRFAEITSGEPLPHTHTPGNTNLT